MTDHAWKLENIALFASPWLGLIIAALLIIATGGLVAAPDRWDRATVIHVCPDGTKVFRMEDGEYRVRYRGFRSYHAIGPDVCVSQ